MLKPLIALALMATTFVAAQATQPPPSNFPSTPGFFCNNVTTNCTGHADAVGGGYINAFDERVCNCTCSNQWYGEKCQFCESQFNQSDNCGSCAAGFVSYPNCTDDRCTQSDCSNHAKKVTGFRATGCNCTCVNQYAGETCDYCAPKYNPASVCGSCASGFEKFPDCYKKCTIEGNCSINAISVSGNDHDGCNCDCAVSYAGPRCTVCPPGYDPSTCASCLPGYGPQYPTCKRLCTIEANCSGTTRALQVSGIASESCNCTCRNQWAKPDCAVCPAQYAGAFCSRCQTGYDFYPDCVICTMVANCSGHSEQEPTYNTQSKTCECGTCRNGWEGTECETCPPRYNANIDCGACAPDYDGNFPNCDRVCTNANACNNHASKVTGTFNSGCQCTCEHQWEGGSCAICPEKYDAQRNCAACASGHFPDYPTCTPLPTSAPPTTTPAPFVPPTPNPVQNGTTSAPTTDSPGSNDTASPFSIAPTLAPSDSNTTDSPSDTTMAPVPQNESSVTPETPPSRTKVQTSTVTVSASRTLEPTLTREITLSNSTSLTDTRCASFLYQCLASPNAVPDRDPVNCSCICYHQWSNPFCEFCHPRFNSTNNCSSCSPNYVFYPLCPYASYISGNWSFDLENAPQHLRPALRAGLLRILAQDINDFIGNLTSCPPVNATAFAMEMFEDQQQFSFDIDVLDPSPGYAENASSCIFAALQDARVVDSPNSRLLLQSLFPNGNVSLTLLNFSANVTSVNPCGEVQCRNGDPLPPLAAAPDDVPIGAIVGGILGLLFLIALLALLAFLFLKRGKAAGDNRNGLRERKLDDMELLWCAQEMDEQSLENAQIQSGSTVRSTVRRQIPSKDI